jgi:AraC-like DNA-binding protein
MRGERALRHVTARDESLVLACGLSRSQRAYAADALVRRGGVRTLDFFDELDRLLPTLTRCDAVILPPADGRGRNALGVVERLTREWPGTAIVIFCPSTLETPPAIRSLVLAGAHQIVFEGVHDTASAVATAVENARRDSAAETVLARLQPVVPTPLHSMAHVVVARPDVMATVEAVAAALGVHRKTLVNRCAQHRSLQPAELIMWCRLAMVGYFLERTGSTVESIGITLGFPSHTALRNVIKRYTRLTATEVRDAGGLAAVLDAMQERLTEWRQPGTDELPIE